MPILKAARLEGLFGGPIDDSLTYAQVKGLIPNVGEAPDLDFKRDLYASTDSGRKSLCSDIAALANANGGVLILGMDEDAQGRARADTGVSIADSEKSRIWQTVLDTVRPKPVFGIVPVEDPRREGTGFLVIWVARSADPPHALVMPNKALLYPRRIGTQTVHLSEIDVADSYRARFIGYTDRLTQAKQIESDFVTRLNPTQAFVVVTLVPDLLGTFTIDTAAFQAFERSNVGHTFGAFGIRTRSFNKSTVRHRRLVGMASWEPGKPYSRGACELHQDGSGVFATDVQSHPRNGEVIPEVLIDNQSLVLGVATAIQYLALHAQDRAGTSGLASLRATIVGGEGSGSILVSSVGWPNERVGYGTATTAPEADALADIDELRAGGRGLVSATYRLASGLFQEFGEPEAPLVTPSGDIRLPYWHHSGHDSIRTWATAVGVQTLSETIN
jgi:Putative DNA-binding domain